MKLDTRTYRRHRRALMRRLPDGPILIAGGREIVRNYDVNYPFRQNSNFLYLTGVEEPGCRLLLDAKSGTETLFIPRIDNHHRIWEGPVPSPAEARRTFGVKTVRYADELAKALGRVVRRRRRAYADRTAWSAARTRADGPANRPGELEDALWELRTLKTPGELKMLKRAGAVSGRGHRAVMKAARAGMREYEVQAVFESVCRKAGLKHLAYPSIVAAGRNAAVLHYRRNDAPLRSGGLLLIDAGAECRGYAADITRTFPVSGRFSARQRAVYELVLETQRRCIELARPGLTSAELHVESMRLVARGLKDLRLLRGDVEDLVLSGAVRVFYPHGIGHLLGLDVHDGLGGRRRRMKNPTKVPVRFIARLEPGMAITVEPGIYFIEALLRDPKIRKRFRGRVDFKRAADYLPVGGVRIEDDVVVRAKGAPRNLTDVPKEVRDVERACRR